jgi:hypothetical protein
MEKAQVLPWWEEILPPGETVLWQGRPDTGVAWSDILSMTSVHGLLAIGFGVLWMHTTGETWASGHFPLFGLIFVAAGLYFIVGRLLWEAVLHRWTYYTLTDQAAYIATDLLGQKLDRHELHRDMPLELEDGAPGTVWFAERIVHRPGEWRTVHGDTEYVPPRTDRYRIGFRRIGDARAVWRRLSEAKGRVSAGLA